MMNVQRLQIGTDHAHHSIDRAIFNDNERFIFRHFKKLVAKLFGKRLTNRHQIIARIKTRWDLANVLT